MLAPTALLAALALTVAHPAPQAAGPPPGTPSAHPFSGTPTVGALFPDARSRVHFCTAAVIQSPRGNALISAAHCQHGSAAGEIFVPGFADGRAPYGRWRVTGAHFTPGWLTARTPSQDFTVLTVAPQRRRGRLRQIQSVTGANRIGAHLIAGVTVTVPAYNLGASRPVTCTAHVHTMAGYGVLRCNDYLDGSSGAPFLYRRHGVTEVLGVIGGLHQGGCEPWVSYAAPLRLAANVLRAAEAGARPEDAPAPGSDGCHSGL